MDVYDSHLSDSHSVPDDTVAARDLTLKTLVPLDDGTVGTVCGLTLDGPRMRVAFLTENGGGTTKVFDLDRPVTVTGRAS